MGNKCCTPNSTINCDLTDHPEYAMPSGHYRKGGRTIRQNSSKQQQRNIEGMKRQIDETNNSSKTNISKMTAFNLVDSIPEENQISFVKPGKEDNRDVSKATIDFNPTDFK